MRPGGGGAVCRVPPERLEHQFNKFAADLRLVAGGFAIGLDDAREMVDEVEDRPGRFAHVTLFLLARGIASPALRAGAKVEYTCRASSVKALLCLGLAIAILALVRYKTSPVQRNLVLPHALRTAGWMQQFASTAGSPSRGEGKRFCSMGCWREYHRASGKRNVCRHCGAVYRPRSGSPKSKFCSKNCFEAHRREHPEEYCTSRRVRVECEGCGREFEKRRDQYLRTATPLLLSGLLEPRPFARAEGEPRRLGRARRGRRLPRLRQDLPREPPARRDGPVLFQGLRIHAPLRAAGRRGFAGPARFAQPAFQRHEQPQHRPRERSEIPGPQVPHLRVRRVRGDAPHYRAAEPRLQQHREPHRPLPEPSQNGALGADFGGGTPEDHARGNCAAVSGPAPV